MATEIDTALVLRLEATLSKFEKQMAKARASARQTTVGIQGDFNGLNKNLAAGSTRAATAMTKFVNISGRGRFVLQNTASQIGDIAVQLQGGTNAAKVMAQQLPQVFGGFGALGGALGLLGPLLGTVAAVGIPVAAMLLRNGEEAEEASKKVKTFAERLADAQTALSNAERAMAAASVGGMDDLLKKYGDVTDAIQTLSRELANIEIRAAEFQVGNILDETLGASFEQQLTEALGQGGAALVRGSAEEIALVRQNIADLQAEISTIEMANQFVPPGLREDLALMRGELALLEGDFSDVAAVAGDITIPSEVLSDLRNARAELEAAQEAMDFSAIADAAARLRSLLQASGQEIDQGVLDGLTQAEDLARQMAARLEDAEQAASDTADAGAGIGPSLQGGVAAAKSLADWLGVSLDTALKIQALGPQGQPNPNGAPTNYRGDPRQYGGSGYEWENREGIIFNENYKPPRKGGGGGGGESDLEKLTREYESLRAQIDPTFASMQKLGNAQETLNSALQAGLISQDEFTALMGAAEEQFRETGDAARELGQELGDALGDMAVIMLENVGNIEEMEKAMAQFARNAAKELLKLAISKGFQALLGLDLGGGSIGGSSGGGFLASLFGGMRAEGGPVSAGKAYVVGEKRPELFVPNTSGRIIPQVPSSGGGTTLTVNINGEFPAGSVQESSGRIDIELGRMMSDVIARGGTDRAMRARFGATPRGSGA